MSVISANALSLAPWKKFKLAHLNEQDEARICLKIKREYDNAVAWDKKNWDRCVDNWRLYWGIDSELGMGQWPADVASEMLRQRRQIATYNMAGPTVDNIAGGIMKAPFGADFVPVDTGISTLTYKIKNILYSTKEKMDYRSQETDLIVGGLIFQGVWEMYISREYNKKFGDIATRACLPGEVMFDPYWKYPSSKKCMKAWKRPMVTPMQMLEIFKDKQNDIIKAVGIKARGNAYLEQLAKLQEDQGDEYGNNNGVIPYDFNDPEWGTQLQLIEFYHMEKVVREIEYVLLEDGQKIRIPGHLKDSSEKLAWLNENVANWQPDAVFTDEEEEMVQFVTIICPTLSQTLVLSHGPTEIQCGRLQFFPWSAKRLNGEVGGIIDAIKDAQRTINYWESLLTYKIQVEGGGGALMADPADFETPAEFDDFCRNRNNPIRVFKLRRGALRGRSEGPAVPVTKSAFPREAMEHLKHMIETVWPRISKVSPASQGRQESPAESGYLYRLKKLQSEIEQHTIYEGLRNFWNEFYEAWLFQATHTYGNQIEREFYDPKTKEAFKINEHKMDVDDSGNVIESIIDDISRLKEIRHRVTVSESEDSPTRKVEIMQTSTELLKTIPQSKPLTIQELSHTLASQLDAFDDEKKAQLEEYHELEMMVGKQQLKTQFAELKLKEVQAMGQIQLPPQGAEGESGAETGAGMPPPASTLPQGTMPVNPGYQPTLRREPAYA